VSLPYLWRFFVRLAVTSKPSIQPIWLKVYTHCNLRRKEKKTTQAAKSSSHQLRKRGHMGRKAPSPEKERQSVRIRRVAGRQASRPLLIDLKVRRILKRTSGLNKLMSIVHRMSMELESEFLDSL